MFSDLDDSLRLLMLDYGPIKEAGVTVVFDTPKRDWSARLGKPAINCFLLDVRENPQLRAHQWEPARGEPQHPQHGHNVAYRKRSPLRLDCTYLVSAWAATPGDEHLLLSYAFLALARFPVLPEEQLTGALRNSAYEIRTRLAGHDVLPNLSDVWNALGTEVRPCLSYVVTLALDPWTPVADALVRMLSLSVGEENQPAQLQNRRLDPQGIAFTANAVGGIVRRRENPAEVLNGVEICVAGTGLYTRSGGDGRFRFGGLLPGEYVLTALVDGREAIHKPVQIPADNGDAYDLIV